MARLRITIRVDEGRIQVGFINRSAAASGGVFSKYSCQQIMSSWWSAEDSSISFTHWFHIFAHGQQMQPANSRIKRSRQGLGSTVTRPSTDCQESWCGTPCLNSLVQYGMLTSSHCSCNGKPVIWVLIHKLNALLTTSKLLWNDSEPCADS